MFDNIGGKIKALAKIVCWIGIAISTISGIIMIAGGSGKQYYNGSNPAVMGFLTIILGSLASWVGSFLTYGFGQLIEKTEDIHNELKRLCSPSTNDIQAPKFIGLFKQTEEKRTLENGGWKCSCGRVNYAYVTTCPCGRSKRDEMKKSESV